MNDYKLKVGEMDIVILNLPTQKHPVLGVRFEGESRLYKVATFSSEAKAKWFIECLEEQLREAPV